MVDMQIKTNYLRQPFVVSFGIRNDFFEYLYPLVLYFKVAIYRHKYQCCGSGMFIPDPGSRIPDPKTATKEREEKN
jgi:hypothetical protein